MESAQIDMGFPEGKVRAPMKIGHSFRALSRVKPAKREDEAPFAPYIPPKTVHPNAKIAMDDIGMANLAWAQGSWMGSGLYAEGQTFIGYPELSLMAQRPEYRMIVSTIAEEMTRKWIRISAKAKTKNNKNENQFLHDYHEQDQKLDKVARIEDEFERLDVQNAFRKIAEHDGFFGRGHLYLDTGDGDNPQELQTNLGDGRSAVSKGKVSPERPLRRILVREPVWCYPTAFNASDPFKKDWYQPQHWFVMGKQVHASRLLRFVGREVPDLLKAAYAFGGLSLTQMVKPYVDNWLRTRQSVADIVNAFTVFVIKTNMSGVLSGAGGDDLFARLDAFNATRDNRGLMAIDMESEDFANVSASLAGLHELQAQSLEHIASCTKMPLVKFTGISPSGLNASSEGELRCWEDTIHSYQEALFRPNLTTLLDFVQLSLFGEVDPEIDFDFLPINELTEKEKAELRQLEAQTDQVLVELGAISTEEVRKRVASDPDSPHDGLDVDEMPEMQGDEEGLEGLAGAFGGEGDFAPNSTPSHKSLGLGGLEGVQSEGGFKPAPAPKAVHDCALDHDAEPDVNSESYLAAEHEIAKRISGMAQDGLTPRERRAIARYLELEEKAESGSLTRYEKGLLTTARRVKAAA